MVYPGLDSLVKLIRKKGRGCLLFKRDLWKCYRQIFMDPGSIHLLGFAMNQSLFFDVVLTMGLRIACYICQRITNALMHAYRCLGHEGINYLDDLGGTKIKRLASQAFWVLGTLLKNLGIWKAVGKACIPCTCMTFLSVECDSVSFTLRITEDRLIELQKLLEWWWKHRYASLQDTQSLAGKLNFVCYTVRCGRVFLSWILNFLHEFKGQPGRRLLSNEFKRDIFWWKTFIDQFNGVTMFPETRWAPTRFDLQHR